MISEATNQAFPSLTNDSSVLDHFMEPAYHALECYTRSSRLCDSLDDHYFLTMGCSRVLNQSRSGRDFLQQQAEVFDHHVPRATFFGALHSPRRLQLSREVADRVFWLGCQQQMQAGQDLLKEFPELSERMVAAADGHQIEHACHALRDAKGRHVGAKNLYLLCLHSGMAFNLASVQGDGQYRHEMKVFRQSMPKWLHGLAVARSAPKRDSLFVVDLAYIDGAFWDGQAKLAKAGAKMITRLKDNANVHYLQERSFDREDPVNTGVDHDWLVRFDNNVVMRLILFTDPETGTCYSFLTTDMELRPGLVAWLYFLRWQIEKVFDTSKNKLEERKAWAKGECAREMEGHFMAMTHNLLVLFRGRLEVDHGITDRKVEQKREKRYKERAAAASTKGRKMHPLHRGAAAMLQLSLQFIRCLRNYILRPRSFSKALPRLQAMLCSYL